MSKTGKFSGGGSKVLGSRKVWWLKGLMSVVLGLRSMVCPSVESVSGSESESESPVELSKKAVRLICLCSLLTLDMMSA